MNETIFIGLLLSLIFTELTGISPGGIIVPAYFALYIDSPLRIITTLGLSFACFILVKILSRFTILYGKRKFAIYILIGILLKYLLGYFCYDNLFMVYDIKLTIGYLIPGILAKDIEKQGPIKTILSLFIVILIIKLIEIILW